MRRAVTDHRTPAYRLAIALVRPTLHTLTRREWSGQENIPLTGGAILVANHASALDPLTFAHFVHDAGRLPHFLAKHEVFEIPVAGRIVAGAEQIPVYRESHGGDAYRAAVEAVNAGKCVAVYPEGTLTRDPDLWPMRGKSGAARIALATQAPVIPIAQWGAHEIIGRYQKGVHPFPRKTIRMRAGAPVDLSDLGTEPTAEALTTATNRIMAAITAELEVLRGETAPAERWDPRKHGQSEFGRMDPSALSD